jgi:hypothetical protein
MAAADLERWLAKDASGTARRPGTRFGVLRS